MVFAEVGVFDVLGVSQIPVILVNLFPFSVPQAEVVDLVGICVS